MAKTKLKRSKLPLQNGNCALSGDALPKDLSLIDTDRILPKAEGGMYQLNNYRIVDPIAHQKRHGTYRKREKKLEALKSLVDDRQQVMKVAQKINNQLRAYKRRTDHLSQDTVDFLTQQSKPLKAKCASKQREIEKALKTIQNPLIQAGLSVIGIGPITIAYCLVYIDLEKANHASSLWAYVGLDKPSHARYTKGTASGGNKSLRTALYSMANAQVANKKAPYRLVYDRIKQRLSISENIVKSRNTQGKAIECMWKDTKPSHRHGAALRAIMKHFLADYWMVGRTLAGLPTSPLYAEAMLGGTHRTIMPEERGWKY